MDLQFGRHALQQMAIREIDYDDVQAVLARADRVVHEGGERYAYYAVVGGRPLGVVLERSADPPAVVTVLIERSAD